jgi:hypothetical protein
MTIDTNASYLGVNKIPVTHDPCARASAPLGPQSAPSSIKGMAVHAVATSCLFRSVASWCKSCMPSRTSSGVSVFDDMIEEDGRLSGGFFYLWAVRRMVMLHATCQKLTGKSNNELIL